MPLLDITTADGNVIQIDSAALQAAIGAPTAPAAATPAEPTPTELALSRRLALVEAGIDVKSPIGGMFLQTYAGELTPEAILAAASPLGLAPAETGTATTLAPGEERQTDVRGQLQHEATTSPGTEPPVHPGIAGFQDGLNVFARGGSYTDGVAAYINRVNRATIEDGDTRFVMSQAGPGEPTKPREERTGYMIPREVDALRPRVVQPA